MDPRPGAPLSSLSTSRSGLLALLAAVTLPHLTISLGGTVPGVLMPLLQRDLQLDPVQIGWLGGARFAGLIAFSIPAAAAVTRLGLRRSIVAVQVGFALTLFGLALAPHATTAVIAVAAGSVFFAAVNPTTTTAVIVRFPAAFRAQAMNTKQVGVPLGSLLAALVMPALAAAAGWRGSAIAAAILAVACAAVSWVLYGARDEPAQSGALRDPPRFAALLRERSVRLTIAVQALLMAAQATMLTYFVVYLVGRGVTLAGAAAYLALMQFTGVGSRIFWGVVAQHGFGGRRRPALLAVIVLSAAGVAALALMPSAPSPWMLGPDAVLLGIGVMAWAGMVELIRAELVSPATTATATGLGYALASIGAVIGPPLFGAVTEVRGFPVAWAALAAILVGATLIAIRLDEPAALAAAAAQTPSRGL